MNMLKGYTQADYSVENWMILLDIKAAADTEIDNAASVADVMTALNNAQAAMAAIHTLLDDAKAAAHASLNAALSGYAQGDYSPENWTILLNAMTMGDTEHADSVADVAMVLSDAQAAMAAVHTLLTDAKIAAHASLETASAGYTQDDYSPDDWTALNGCKTAGDAAIDEAADLVGVEAAQLAAVEGMDAVQTIVQTLAAAKSAAHDALSTALGTHSDSDYTSDDWTALNGYKTAGDAAIDEAEDLAGVEAAQSAAVAGMDAVQTIAQTLAAAKSAAHDALAKALETYWESDYIDDGWTVLNGCKTAGDTAIDEAADLAGVEEAQSAAAAGMEAVQTFAQILVAAKSAAHDALAEVLGLRVSNDPGDDCTASNEAEEIVDTAVEEVPVIDETEESAAADLPTFPSEAEGMDAATVCDAVSDSQEEPATSDGTPDAAEEMASEEKAPEEIVSEEIAQEEQATESEPAVEGITPDVE